MVDLTSENGDLLRMRVAIVHYWLINLRGGEKVIEALCEMFPQADIFTHVYCPERMPERINQHSVTTSFIGKLPFAARLYQIYLPLMPVALEQLDLREYDLVISSESGPAKGVLTRPETLHLCYCHTPMRYVWSMYHDYARSTSRIKRFAMLWLIHRLRLWDVQSANRVDFFIANSRNVERQIRKYYGRSAVVVHPPVDVDSFRPSEHIQRYYLCVGQLVRYKRTDLAIEAFNILKKPLVIIGEGREYKNLRRLAGPTITFLGYQDAATVRRYYAQCQALVFPGEEDFGLVPLEAMASGRPVLAFGRGGALETVIPKETGILFQQQTPAALVEAVRAFEAATDQFVSSRLIEHAAQFSKEKFKARFLHAMHEAARVSGDDVLPTKVKGAAVRPVEEVRGFIQPTTVAQTAWDGY